MASQSLSENGVSKSCNDLCIRMGNTKRFLLNYLQIPPNIRGIGTKIGEMFPNAVFFTSGISQ